MGLLLESYQHHRANTSGKRIQICCSPKLLPVQIIACSGQKLSLRYRELHTLVKAFPDAAMCLTDTNKLTQGATSEHKLTLQYFQSWASLMHSFMSELGCSELGEHQRASEEGDLQGSLSSYTRKTENSKLNTPAGKLKPTHMSTRKSDSKVITMPLQQSFTQESSF